MQMTQTRVMRDGDSVTRDDTGWRRTRVTQDGDNVTLPHCGGWQG